MQPRTGRRPWAGGARAQRWRSGAGAVALLLTLLACEQGPPEGDGPSVVLEDGESADEPSADGGGGAEAGEARDGASGEQGASSGRDSDGPSQPAPSDGADEAQEGGADEERGDDANGGGSDDGRDEDLPDDHGPLGAACRTYLRGQVPRLTIEVLHQSGARPSEAATDHLVDRLGAVLDKPAGIGVQGPREIPGDGRTWTTDGLRELAAEHRSARTDRDGAAMVVLAVSGDYEESGTLGVAVSATELVLFPDEIGDLVTGVLGGRTPIERAVLLHEAGHLLCLVNIGYESERDHEDPEHPNHSRHRDSVMYWAIPNDAVTQVFSGSPPDRFHADDLADLAALREGRY